MGNLKESLVLSSIKTLINIYINKRPSPLEGLLV
jgi:hypothetical protein